MKIIVCRTDPPIRLKLDSNEIQFHDYPYGWDLEVGDQIHFGYGARSYEVTDVQPANEPNYPKDLRLVTAKPCGS